MAADHRPSKQRVNKPSCLISKCIVDRTVNNSLMNNEMCQKEREEKTNSLGEKKEKNDAARLKPLRTEQVVPADELTTKTCRRWNVDSTFSFIRSNLMTNCIRKNYDFFFKIKSNKINNNFFFFIWIVSNTNGSSFSWAIRVWLVLPFYFAIWAFRN